VRDRGRSRPLGPKRHTVLTASGGVTCPIHVTHGNDTSRQATSQPRQIATAEQIPEVLSQCAQYGATRQGVFPSTIRPVRPPGSANRIRITGPSHHFCVQPPSRQLGVLRYDSVSQMRIPAVPPLSHEVVGTAGSTCQLASALHVPRLWPSQLVADCTDGPCIDRNGSTASVDPDIRSRAELGSG
jgi:hypothetical protein